MGGVLRFKNGDFNVKNRLCLGTKLVTRDTPASQTGLVFGREVFWEGWGWEERLLPWRDPDSGLCRAGWLSSGVWKRADVLALAFNEGPRWYEVPPHHVIKAIVLVRPDEIVMKILTRPPIGKEARVKPRFTLTGPQTLFPPRNSGLLNTVVTPF